MKKALRILIIVTAGLFLIIIGLYTYAIVKVRCITRDPKMEDPNPVINMSDYVVIKTGGVNGSGVAAADMNGRYLTDYNIYYVGDAEAMEEATGKSAKSYLLLSVEVRLSQYTDLSNGDEIKYQIIIHNDCEDVLNCSFEGLKGTYIVSGLEE